MDEQNTNPTSSKFNFNKVFASIGIILIVIIIISVGVWNLVQNAEDKASKIEETTPITVATTSAKPKTTTSSAIPADWKTYKDSQASFKYPGSWKEYDNITTPSFSEKDPSSVSPGVEVPTIGVDKSPVLSVFSTDFAGLVSAKVGQNWNSGAKIYSKTKNLTIDGQNAVWIRQTLDPKQSASGPAIDHIFVQKSSKLYDFYLRADKSTTLDLYTDIVNKIISTFKFL